MQYALQEQETDNNKAGLIYYLLKVHTFILFKVQVLYFLTALGSREKMSCGFYASQVILVTAPGEQY